jgi:hypothetical protein
MEEKKEEGVGTQDADPKAILSQVVDLLQQAIAAMGGGGGEPAAEPAPEQAEGVPSEDESPEEEGEQSERLIAAANEVIAVAKEEKEEGEEMLEQDEKTEGTLDHAPKGFSVKAFLKQIATRDRLAETLKPHVGTFDHAEMTIGEVAKYGCGKLGLKAGRGQELPALQGYLQAKQPPRPMATAMDSAGKPHTSAVEKYLQGA